MIDVYDQWGVDVFYNFTEFGKTTAASFVFDTR